MHVVNTVLIKCVVSNLLHLWLIFISYMVGIKFMVHFYYIYGVFNSKTREQEPAFS